MLWTPSILTRYGQQIQDLLIAEKNHAEGHHLADVKEAAQQLREFLEKQIAGLDKRIASFIEQDADLNHKAARLDIPQHRGSCCRGNGEYI